MTSGGCAAKSKTIVGLPYSALGGMTMMVALVALASVATARGTRWADRVPARVAAPPIARPARLANAVSPNMPFWAIAAISGAASAAPASISAATVRTAGTAEAQFWGTEIAPLVPARPTRAVAGDSPSEAYEPLSSPLCSSGDNAPTIGLGFSSGPMPWMPTPRLGILMLTCHQFLSKLPNPSRDHGPAA